LLVFRRLASPVSPFSSISVRACSTVNVPIDVPFKTHLLSKAPSQETTTTKSEILSYFREMATMRRLEIICDQLYKAKFIRGFCHLYDGQEACSTGMEAGLIPGDSLITAYRDHCQAYKPGGTSEGILAELMGRAAGHSRGKGGSMHFYAPKHNFYGGNGIVGAQTAVGTGVAFKHKYTKDGKVCVTMFGDGAANQGQLAESMNMAFLWKLPTIYVCENNHFGMGTSCERAASGTTTGSSFYERGNAVPGLRVDGMDVYAVREGIKFAADHARNGNGPMFVELDTYRYHGHSMSDPGSSYRTRQDVEEIRATRDPIEKVKKRIMGYGFAEEAELKAVEREIRQEIEETAERVKKFPYPDSSEVFTDVYHNNEIPIRAADGTYAFAK